MDSIKKRILGGDSELLQKILDTLTEAREEICTHSCGYSYGMGEKCKDCQWQKEWWNE